MTRRTIPQVNEVICDGCGVVCNGSLGKGRRVADGVLMVKQHGLDMLGSPACDASVNFDLCDECLSKMVKILNDGLESLRK